MRIVLGIPHALLREGLRDLLKRWSGAVLVGVSPAAAEAVRLARRTTPDVVVVARSSSPAEDARAIAALRQTLPSCKVALLENVGSATHSEALGADWNVPSNVGSSGLVKGLWELCASRGASGHAVPEGQLEESAAVPRLLLTRREHDVVCAVCEGLPNRAVAQRLGISEKTVKNHLSSIYRRTKVSGRTRLVLWALERGLSASNSPPESRR
jgi:two-component system response regulator DegU